jgi:hypothetical protein
MAMTAEAKTRIQMVLAFAIVAAGGRTAYIFYQRHQSAAEEAAKQAAKSAPLNPDYYVVPKKLYPYDLKSARQLTQQPVWVKEGYRYTYFPFSPASRAADFRHAAGTLLPIQRLQISDVVIGVSPEAPGVRQVLAVFDQEGKSYAFSIGVEQNGDYKIYSDEMLFIQDPHELYQHWPPEVWTAIANHEVRSGMNELQADFAVGMGIPQSSADSSIKTVRYPNGGKGLTVTYRNGKASEITPGG